MRIISGYASVLLLLVALAPIASSQVPDTIGIDTLITPTDQWISIYCENPMLDSDPLLPGDTIAVYDPDGVLSGIGLVRADGSYGFIPVYRDDTTSHDMDEGADPGDILTFKINGLLVETSIPVMWTSLGDRFQVCNFTTEDGGEEGCVDIALANGWNFVSWNVAYSADVETAFADILDCIGVVHAFDGSAMTYDPKKPEFSTLMSVDYYHGYAIRIVGNECQDDTLTICGPPIADAGIPIHEGWNFISYWPQDELAPEDALSSILENVVTVYTFDHGVKIFRPNHPGFQTLDLMREGFGYWIMSTSEDFLIYPGFDNGSSMRVLAVAQTGNRVTSRTWMSLYGRDLTLDGQYLPSGSKIEAFTADGTLCGSGVYANGILKFTPIFGRDNSSEEASSLPAAGETVYLAVNDTPVLETVTWQEEGALVRLANFSSARADVMPGSYSLSQNYPNPFNPSTEISFNLPVRGEVHLEIYNLLGQNVRTLLNGTFEVGSHTVTWDGRADNGTAVASGVYLYRLQSGNYSLTKKMTLMK